MSVKIDEYPGLHMFKHYCIIMYLSFWNVKHHTPPLHQRTKKLGASLTMLQKQKRRQEVSRNMSSAVPWKRVTIRSTLRPALLILHQHFP